MGKVGDLTRVLLDVYNHTHTHDIDTHTHDIDTHDIHMTHV